MSFWTLDVKSVNWVVWRKRVAWLIVIAIFLAVLFEVILPYCGIFLGLGGSLEPQVSWLSISREVKLKPGEIPEVGRLYTYRRPATTAKTPGARLKQRLGWRYATKWCWAVDEESQTWSTATDDGDMPFSAIDRKVVAIWDWQWLSNEVAGDRGRLSNYLRTRYGSWEVNWSPDAGFVAAGGWRRGSVTVYRGTYPPEVVFQDRVGYREALVNQLPHLWRNGRLVYPVSSEPHVYGVFEPASGSEYVFNVSESWQRVFEPNRKVLVEANLESILGVTDSPEIRVDGTVISLDQMADNWWIWEGYADRIETVNCLIKVRPQEGSVYVSGQGPPE